MDHGSMDHGGMDMPAMCNMNVRLLCLTITAYMLNNVPDALHMEHNESLHNLPLVAHPLNFHAPRLPRRRIVPHSWLRTCSRNKQTIRS